MTVQSPHISNTAQKRESSIKPSAVPVVSTDDSNAEEVIASNALLGQKGVCIIVHNAEQYILRRTRNNKLILTK